MNGFTVEETNLLSIYHEGGKQETTRKSGLPCRIWTRKCGRWQTARLKSWTS